MNVNQPAFKPDSAATVKLTAGIASGRVQVQTGDLSRHIRVYNSGTVTAFLRFGDSAVVATTTTDYPIPGGAVEILSAPHPYVAAITISGAPDLYFSPGEGI